MLDAALDAAYRRWAEDEECGHAEHHDLDDDEGLQRCAFVDGWETRAATPALWMYSESNGRVVWDAGRNGGEWALPDTEHVVARLQARIAELEREVGAAHADAAARETARGEG